MTKSQTALIRMHRELVDAMRLYGQVRAGGVCAGGAALARRESAAAAAAAQQPFVPQPFDKVS